MNFIEEFKKKLEEVNSEMEECENFKPSITKELYNDIYRLWDETFIRTKNNNEPIIALERFKNKYEVR